MKNIVSLKKSNQSKVVFGYKVRIKLDTDWSSQQDLFTFPKGVCILKGWADIKVPHLIDTFNIFATFDGGVIKQYVQTNVVYNTVDKIKFDSVPSFFPEDKQTYLMSMVSSDLDAEIELDLHFLFTEYGLNNGKYFSARR